MIPVRVAMENRLDYTTIAGGQPLQISSTEEQSTRVRDMCMYTRVRYPRYTGTSHRHKSLWRNQPTALDGNLYVMTVIKLVRMMCAQMFLTYNSVEIGIQYPMPGIQLDYLTIQPPTDQPGKHKQFCFFKILFHR